MQKSISIQLKAAFLIMVFSMNTIIGFACALGIDMGFNSKHHHDDDEEATEASVHIDGKEHQHHQEETKHHHHSKEDSEKDGCCNDGVIKFQNLEKNLNQKNSTVIYSQLFATIVSTLWSINIFNSGKPLPQQYKASVFHPPPTDILIAIQRFQI
jgi:ABC-type nickel/cobalt efflux system permease component RcnA